MRSRILIVDDNPMNLAIMEEVLGDDYDILLAESGEAALEFASGFRPDLILLDIMMPGIDGYETCRRLRADIGLGLSKIILVSAKAMLSERLQGYETGADDYITKPFDPSELLAKVRVFLRLKRTEEMDALKSDLLGLLSHEIRTPLVGIQGCLDALQVSDSLTAEEKSDWIEMGNLSYKRLEALVKKTQMLCELRAQNIPLKPDEISAQQLVTSIAQEVQGDAGASIVVDETIDPDLTILADDHYTRIALRAIVENATRHSPAPGSVRLEAEADVRQARIRVVDAGAGIAADRHEAVFQPFAIQDVDHHSKGHGLSLAVARAIMRNQGGDIELADNPGGGCQFTLIALAEPDVARV